MDDEGREVPTTARWLAWVAAVLLAVAGVSASIVEARDGRSSDGFVSAAGGVTSTPELPTTSSSSTTQPRSANPATSTTVARTTTVPKAAAAVLAAIGSTTTLPPTTQPPAPTTTAITRPPTTTTTAPTTTSTSSTSTTSTTVPARAALTIVNNHPSAIVATVNGTEFPQVPAGQQADVTVAVRASDTVEVRVAADAACKASDSGTFFSRDGRYLLTVVAGQANCAGGPAPELTVAVKP